MSLKTQVLSLLFAASLICSSPLAGAEKAKPASLTAFGAVVDVNVVNVDVYATDKSGKRVNDLRQGDFEVLEDGKRVAITNFVASRLPGAGSPQAPANPAAAASPARAPPGEGWYRVLYGADANIRP